jgi:hypothetical protein
MVASMLCGTRYLAGSLRRFSSDAYRKMQEEKAARGRKKLVTVGIPFLLFTLGGCYMLSVFLQTHMEIKDRRVKSTTARKFDLEEEHRKMMAQLDIDNYTLSRIPRPEEVDVAKANRVVIRKPSPKAAEKEESP